MTGHHLVSSATEGTAQYYSPQVRKDQASGPHMATSMSNVKHTELDPLEVAALHQAMRPGPI